MTKTKVLLKVFADSLFIKKLIVILIMFVKCKLKILFKL